MEYGYSTALRKWEDILSEISDFLWDEEQFMAENAPEVAKVYQEELSEAFGELMKIWLTTPKFFGTRDQEGTLTRSKTAYMRLQKAIVGKWNTK